MRTANLNDTNNIQQQSLAINIDGLERGSIVANAGGPYDEHTKSEASPSQTRAAVDHGTHAISML